MLVARLEVLGEVDQRGAIRFHISSDSTLRGLDGRPKQVLVENFSRTGFLFRSHAEFAPGTLVAVGLSGAGSREAQVVWRDGERHGCEFLVPLPQSKIERAFEGQKAVVANLEAELRRRLGEPPEAAEADEPSEPAEQPSKEPPLSSLVDRLTRGVRHLLGRDTISE